MYRHLTDHDLGNYTLNMLTDADREVLDQHLEDCPACRTAVEEHTQQQTKFRVRLQTELATLSPSPRMNFASIAPAVRQLQRAQWRQRLLEACRTFGPALATAGGLVLAVLGLLLNVTWPVVGLQQDHSLSLPFAAGLMFSVPVMSHFRWDVRQRADRLWGWLASGMLWLGTAILGLYEIALLREVLLRAYMRFGPPSSQLLQQAQALGSWGVFLLGALWVVLVIGGGEYHYRHVGQRASWRLFGATVCTQLALLALPLLV